MRCPQTAFIAAPSANPGQDYAGRSEAKDRAERVLGRLTLQIEALAVRTISGISFDYAGFGYRNCSSKRRD